MSEQTDLKKFRQKEDQKEDPTMSKYPSAWDFVHLDNIFTDTRYGTDAKSHSEEQGHPTLRIPNIADKMITLNDLKYSNISDKEAERLALEKGDILIIRTNGNPKYVGRCATVSEREQGFVYASYLIRIRVDEDKTIPDFICYFLNSGRGWKEMNGWIRSTAGNYNISIGGLEKLKVPLPPIEEQKKIAGIFKNIDELIQRTEEIVNQASRLKKGLLQQFFREGVWEHDDFTQSTYGKIPSSWKVKRIKSIADRIGSGGTPNTDNQDYFGGQIPWVKTDDLNGGEVNDTKTNITELGLEESAAKLFPKGTVVFAMYGGSLGQHGRLGMESAMNQACCGIVANTDVIDPYYLHQQLIYRKERLTSLSAGTHQQNLTQSTIEKFPVVVPSLEEQQEIVDVLQSVDETIRQEQEYRDQLKRLKKGLMQDLLSGEVRTKGVDIDVPEEVTQYG